MTIPTRAPHLFQLTSLVFFVIPFFEKLPHISALVKKWIQMPTIVLITSAIPHGHMKAVGSLLPFWYNSKIFRFTSEQSSLVKGETALLVLPQFLLVDR